MFGQINQFKQQNRNLEQSLEAFFSGLQGVIVARTFTDPVWFFITDWFPIYLVAKGISLKSGLIAVWIPFVAADLGNFFGGAASGI